MALTIRASGSRLLRLLDDTVLASRLQADDLTPEPGACHVADLLQNVVRSARDDNEGGVPVVVDIDPALPDVVLLDAPLVGAALFQLVDNALRWTQEGLVVVSCAPAGEGSLRFTVSDTGPGIKPADQQRIFEPFTQLGSPSNKADDVGTGLGLGIVAQVAQLHGGTTGVTSKPGSGSVFWLELPVEEAPQAVAV